MSRSPSIVPDSIDRDIYIVPDDFGLQAKSGARPTTRKLTGQR
jgi:hypothetical protein